MLNEIMTNHQASQFFSRHLPSVFSSSSISRTIVFFHVCISGIASLVSISSTIPASIMFQGGLSPTILSSISPTPLPTHCQSQHLAQKTLASYSQHDTINANFVFDSRASQPSSSIHAYLPNCSTLHSKSNSLHLPNPMDGPPDSVAWFIYQILSSPNLLNLPHSWILACSSMTKEIEQHSHLKAPKAHWLHLVRSWFHSVLCMPFVLLLPPHWVR